MADRLPPGWRMKESSSRPGKFYYINSKTGETTWDLPTEAAEDNSDSVQVRHILKKHSGSRRPSSWRVQNITQSKDTSIQQITEIKQILESELASKGYDAMHALFIEIAKKESDCSSAAKGGDLGSFGRGQMQRPFEEASFSLPIGKLSGIVDTDSGIHILLRIA